MKARFLTILLMDLSGLVGAAAPPPLANPNAGMAASVTDLLGKMTLEEKIGQLNLLSTGFDITGPVASKGVEASVRRGVAPAGRKRSLEFQHHSRGLEVL